MSSDTVVSASSGRSAPVQRLSRAAVRDLAAVVVFVWAAVGAIHLFNVPEALAEWNETHTQWAVDEFTLVSLCVAAALGVFSWRRWHESALAIAEREATLHQLRITESEIASKDRLVSSVSHELRTPLTAIVGYAEMLHGNDTRGTNREAMVREILRQGWDLTHIVDDLLTRARVESKTIDVARVPVHLSAQAAQVLEAWNPEDHIDIEIIGDRDACGIGDPARVRQIVRNLVSNALRYGGDRIVVEAGSRTDVVWLAVVDDGDGVPDDQAERIFDPYYRTGGDDAVPGGVGLGLAISRQLARLMHGDLTLARRDDRTVFELTLPRGEKQGGA
jgi:signal transduction histidine kinase